MPWLLELFSGTGSVGAAFRRAGWQVYSVDMKEVGGHRPTYLGDVLQWRYDDPSLPAFDAVWASPPCTMYSVARTRAKAPRDLAAADRLVGRALEVIRYNTLGRPHVNWWLENPASGLLSSRVVVAGLAKRLVSYCAYGSPYRKNTYLWSNCAFDPAWETRSCPGMGECPQMVGRRHQAVAQRAPPMRDGVRGIDSCSQEELYRMPPQLCDEIAAYATQRFAEEMFD